MGFAAILTLAIGLAMDAAAVSAARGCAVPRVLPHQVVLVAVYFGGFQAFMPLLGWLVGSSIGPSVQAWHHLIAFVLLWGIGGKMLWESRATPDEPRRSDGDPFATKVMCLLALATSIDALAVGVTLPLLKAPIALSLATIGVTTALLSAAGLFAGRRFGAALGKHPERVGGLVLIGLGLKILWLG